MNADSLAPAHSFFLWFSFYSTTVVIKRVNDFTAKCSVCHCVCVCVAITERERERKMQEGKRPVIQPEIEEVVGKKSIVSFDGFVGIDECTRNGLLTSSGISDSRISCRIGCIHSTADRYNTDMYTHTQRPYRVNKRKCRKIVQERETERNSATTIDNNKKELKSPNHKLKGRTQGANELRFHERRWAHWTVSCKRKYN